MRKYQFGGSPIPHYRLPEVAVSPQRGYPHVSKLNDEEKKHFQQKGPIGTAVRNKAEKGRNINAKDVQDFVMSFPELAMESADLPSALIAYGAAKAVGEDGGNPIPGFHKQKLVSDVVGMQHDPDSYVDDVVNFGIDAIGVPSYSSMSHRYGNAAGKTLNALANEVREGFIHGQVPYKNLSVPENKLSKEALKNFREVRRIGSIMDDKEMSAYEKYQAAFNSKLDDKTVRNLVGKDRKALSELMEATLPYTKREIPEPSSRAINDGSDLDLRAASSNNGPRILGRINLEDLNRNREVQEALNNSLLEGVDLGSRIPPLPEGFAEGFEDIIENVPRTIKDHVRESARQVGDEFLRNAYNLGTDMGKLKGRLATREVRKDLVPLKGGKGSGESLLPSLFKANQNSPMEAILKARNTFKDAPKGRYNAAESLSADSAPLFYSVSSGINSHVPNTNFSVDRFMHMNSSSYLHRAGFSQEEIKDYINAELSSKSFNGKKLPAAFIPEGDPNSVKIPSLVLEKYRSGGTIRQNDIPMKKYQFGGGLNYTGFTPTYTPSTSTSLQFSDPSIANPSIYRARPSQGTGMSANTTQGLVGAGVAALGSAVQGISTGMSAQASIDAIKQAKLKRGLSKVEEGKMRAESLPKTGYYGYTYPQRMQYGGYGNSGGVAYDPALAAMNADSVEQNAQADIATGTTNAIVSSIPVIGPIVGAATQASTGIRGALGEKSTVMPDGTTKDTYSGEGEAVVGSLLKPSHEAGFEDAAEGDYLGAVANFAGMGWMKNIVEDVNATRDAERATAKNGMRVNTGGTSAASRMSYQRNSAVMKYGGNSKPNAELEGGEIVEKNSGRDINVKGPSHENGGVPKKLDEGDYVWSDHIKYQGKSMADWYAMFKDNPERVEQLRALQEQLAGRAPQMKDGGTLAKYQTGGKQNSSYDIERALELGYELDEEGHMPSRDHLTGRILKSTEHPTFKKGIDADADLGYRGLIGTDGKVYTLNPNDMPTEGNFAPKKYQWGGYRIPTKTQPGFNMFGQYKDNPELGVGMKGVSVPKSYVQTVTTPPPPKAKKKAAPVIEPVVEPEPPYDVLGDYATVNGPGLGYKDFRPNIQHLSTVDDAGPLDGLASGEEASAGNATGERSKAGKFLKQYGHYGLPIAGAIAQLVANSNSEFGNVNVPNAPKIKTDKQFLERATSDAQEAAADRDYRAALDYAAKSGSGPAQQSAAQMAYENKRSANEQTRERTTEINVQQDAKEKGMNLEADLRTKMANAEFEAQRNATLYDRDMARAEFNRNKGMNVGNIIAGAARDTMSYIGDERHAKAIYGKEGIQDRKYGYSEEMLRKNLKEMGLSDAAIEAAVAKDRLEYQKKNTQGTKS